MGFLADVIARVVEWFVAKFIVEKVTDLEAESKAKSDAAALKAAQTDKEKADALKKAAADTFPPKP